MTLRKIKSESIVQQIIDNLIDEIIKGNLKPGDKIPTETELAQSMGVGRNSVREAIKILVYMGILEIRRAEGTFVCSGFSQTMINPMIYGIIMGRTEDYKYLMEIREMIEVGILNLVINNRNNEELEELHVLLDKLKKTFTASPAEVEKAFDADNEFHNKIAEMSHNPVAISIDNVTKLLLQSIRYNSVKNMLESGRGEELYQAHERIYNLVKNQDKRNLNEAVRGTYFVDKSSASDPEGSATEAKEEASEEESGEKEAIS